MSDNEFETIVDDDAKSAPADRETNGPLDESEANAVRPYVDLGGVRILPREVDPVVSPPSVQPHRPVRGVPGPRRPGGPRRPWPRQ